MKAVLIAGSIVVALATAGIGAAQGSGATVLDDSGCATTPFATVCHDVHTVAQAVATPSGNVSYVMNGTSTTTTTFAFGSGCTDTRTTPVRLHWLRRAGEMQVESFTLVDETSYSCGGYALTCTQTIHGHETAGAMQFGRYELACTTP